MLEGWVWPGLAGPEAGLLAGIVGLGAGFHGSMAVFLNAPPSLGGRFAMTIPGHQTTLGQAGDFFVAIRARGPGVRPAGGGLRRAGSSEQACTTVPARARPSSAGRRRRQFGRSGGAASGPLCVQGDDGPEGASAAFPIPSGPRKSASSAITGGSRDRPRSVANGQRPENGPLEREPYYLETNVPGVFAAGDVRHGSVKRCASAVGEGAMAVTFVHRYLTSG